MSLLGSLAGQISDAEAAQATANKEGLTTTVQPTPSKKSGNWFSNALSDAGSTISGAVASTEKTVAKDVGQVEQTAQTAFKNATGAVAHLGSQISGIVSDAINGVEGALNSLKALALGMKPADLVKLVDGELDEVVKAADQLFGFKAADSITDLSKILIPATGIVAGLFPPSVRGQVVTWADCRKDAAKVVWYICALALVDLNSLKNAVLKVFGITLPADGRTARRYDRGFAPLAALGANLPVIIPVIIVAIIVAVVVIKALAPPNTVAAKIAGAVGGALPLVETALGLPVTQLNPPPPPAPPPPPPAPPPPPPVPVGDDLGHSEPMITYAVIALVVVVVGLLVFTGGKKKKD